MSDAVQMASALKRYLVLREAEEQFGATKPRLSVQGVCNLRRQPTRGIPRSFPVQRGTGLGTGW
jgi:hypothetical protein